MQKGVDPSWVEYDHWFFDVLNQNMIGIRETINFVHFIQLLYPTAS